MSYGKSICYRLLKGNALNQPFYSADWVWSKIKAKVAAGGGSGVLQSREVFLKEAGHSVIESYTVLKNVVSHQP